MKVKGCVEITAGAVLFYPLLLFADTENWLPALLPAVISHEIGHLLLILACGGKILSVRIEAAGICINTTAFHTTGQELLCTGAGPAAGLLWFLITRLFSGGWWVRASVAALVINCFNLLPALPLDGGRLLLTASRSDKLTRACSWITEAVLVLVIVIYRVWALTVPAALILKTCISP